MRAARVAVAGMLCFNGGWLISQSLQEHYSPRRDYLSAMAAVDATHPWIMVGAFIAAAVASCALGVGLIHGLPGRRVTAAAAGCVLSGIGLCVSALARHDCNLARPACADRVDAGLVSRGHEVHDVVSALVFVIAGLSQLMLARGLRERTGHRHVRALSLALGGLGLGLFTYMAITGATDWTGVLQRVSVASSSAWVCCVAVHLHRSDATRGEDHARTAPAPEPGHRRADRPSTDGIQDRDLWAA